MKSGTSIVSLAHARRSQPWNTGLRARSIADELLAVAIAAAEPPAWCSSNGSAEPSRSPTRTNGLPWSPPSTSPPRQEIERVITGHFPQHAILGEEGRGGTEEAPSHGSSTRSTARRTTPTACRWPARRWPSRRRGRRRRGDPRAVPRRAVHRRARRRRLARRRPLERVDTDALDQALVCTGVQSDDPEAIAAFGRRIVALSQPLPGRALPRLAGALPRLRRRRPHRRLPRSGLDLRLGRRCRRPADHRGRRPHRRPRRRTAQPRTRASPTCWRATG